MTLSIRGRLTLWYAGIVIVVLAAGGAAMVAAQSRLALRRLDDELERLAGAVLTVLSNEIDERHELTLAANDATDEIRIPGRVVAILWPDGRLLASNDGGTQSALLAAHPRTSGVGTVAAPGGDLRMIAAPGSHGGLAYAVRIGAPLAPLAAERDALLQALAVGLSLALALAAAGGWLIGRQALEPLAAMANETRAMSTGADMRLTVPPTRDELEQLGQAFNGLLARLETAMAAQRQFMADASHELRTPVSVTRTAAQVMLGREGRSESEYREALAIVAEQAARLTRMVDDMFLLARAEAQARPIEASALYLEELVGECTRAVGVLADARGVTVRTRVDHDAALVGDEALLRQLLVNLLENAVAHTPSGGAVTIALDVAGDRATISVTDSGPGVPFTERERIFERFVRLVPTGPQTGAGLGLPIARWIAEQHGGRLTLESAAPDGARFVVSLPLATRRSS